MAAVAERAKVAAPATDVVAILGAPTGDADRGVGDGGLAVTRFRAGHPATVVFAQVALAGLSCAAVESLAAHELAHVIRRDRTSTASRYAWVLGYLVLVLTGAGLTVTAAVAAPQLAGPAMLATMTAAVAFLGLRVAFDRREEIAADLFAISLTRDLDAAAELMRFYEDNVRCLLACSAARGRTSSGAGSPPTLSRRHGWPPCDGTWSTRRPTSPRRRRRDRPRPATSARCCRSALPHARASG